MKPNRRRKAGRVVVWVLAWMGVVAVAGAQPVRENSAPNGKDQGSGGLPFLVEKAIQSSAGVQATRAQMRQAEAGLRQIQATRLPMLSANVSAMRGNNPVYAFGSLLQQGRFGPEDFAVDALNHPSDLTNFKSALNLGVPIFTGYELTTQSQLTDLLRKEAAFGQDGVIQSLRLQTAGAYLQILFDDGLLSLLEQHIDSSAREVESARRLKDRGVVLGSDYYAALAIAGGLKAWKTQVESDRAQAFSRLAILTGVEHPDVRGILSDRSYVVPHVEDLVRLALERRPDAAVAKAQTASAALTREQAGRSLLPRVQAFASLETNTHDFSYNPFNRMAGVTAQVPFGDAAYFSRKDRDQAGEEAAHHAEEALDQQIRSDVTAAYESYQGLLGNLPQLKDSMAQADQSLLLFRPLYQSGRQSIMEVLRAEEGTVRSAAAYQEALFNLHFGYVRLMGAAGVLDDQPIKQLAEALEVRP